MFRHPNPPQHPLSSGTNAADTPAANTSPEAVCPICKQARPAHNSPCPHCIQHEGAVIKSRLAENEQIHQKLVQLANLKLELFLHELELSNLQTELQSFEQRYAHVIGPRYTKLCTLKARIAELYAKLYPLNDFLQEEVKRARQKAQQANKTMKEAARGDKPPPFQETEIPPSGSEEEPSITPDNTPEDTGDLKKLYREIAKKIHPDLAVDAQDRAIRERLMAEANNAYTTGNRKRLQEILNEWENRMLPLESQEVETELMRLDRKITQIQGQIAAILPVLEELKVSAMHQLLQQEEEARQNGIDFMEAIAHRLDNKIREAELELHQLEREVQEA